MSSQQYSGQRQGPPRHVRKSAGYGAKGEGIAFPTAAPVSVPASSRPVPAPPSQPHLSLPAVPGLYDGEQEGYEEGFEDDPFGPSPTYEPSRLWAPRRGCADGDADHPVAPPTCPENSIWSCTSSTNFRIGLVPKKPDWTVAARRKSIGTR